MSCISTSSIFALSLGFPGGSDGKASVYSAGDLGSIPGLGRSPGEGSGNPPQYSCLENPMDQGAWWAIVHGVAKSRTWLSDLTSLHFKLQPRNKDITTSLMYLLRAKEKLHQWILEEALDIPLKRSWWSWWREHRTGKQPGLKY